MAKSKQQKKKDREKRVARQKLANTVRRREVAKKSASEPESGAPRGKKVITAGVKQKAQVPDVKQPIIHRRSGG